MEKNHRTTKLSLFSLQSVSGGVTFFERLTDPKDTQKLYQATDLTRRQYSIED